MRIAVFVTLGSGLGGLLRYLVALGWRGQALAGLPLATLSVNVIGSAVFGFLASRQAHAPLADSAYFGLTTGILGGFTTYSSFNGELLRMLVEGHATRAFAYAASTGLACLIGGGRGWWLGALK